MVTSNIKNTFNAAWHESVLFLKRMGCAKGLGSIVKSFLTDRITVSEKVEKYTTKVCSQGSALGPILWIALMES